jgi:hypothetical protein
MRCEVMRERFKDRDRATVSCTEERPTVDQRQHIIGTSSEFT